MAQTDRRRAGRRRASSRRTLEEAAGELFLERGYEAATVGEITRRAGVSRNTFFNYFDAKSDVLWGSVDDAVAGLAALLDDDGGARDGLEAVRAALLEAAESFAPEALPLAATQYETMGALEELRASALPRFLALASALERRMRSGRAVPSAGSRVAAYALAGAASAAAIDWARAGSARGSLAAALAAAIDPVCRGLAGDRGSGRAG